MSVALAVAFGSTVVFPRAPVTIANVGATVGEPATLGAALGAAVVGADDGTAVVGALLGAAVVGASEGAAVVGT
jgi:hypothetical protein